MIFGAIGRAGLIYRAANNNNEVGFGFDQTRRRIPTQAMSLPAGASYQGRLTDARGGQWRIPVSERAQWRGALAQRTSPFLGGPANANAALATALALEIPRFPKTWNFVLPRRPELAAGALIVGGTPLRRAGEVGLGFYAAAVYDTISQLRLAAITDLEAAVAAALGPRAARGAAAYAAWKKRAGRLVPARILRALRGGRLIPVDFYPTDNHDEHRFSYLPSETFLALQQIEAGQKEPQIIWSKSAYGGKGKWGALWKTTRGRRSNPNSRRRSLLPASQCRELGQWNPRGSIKIRYPRGRSAAP